MKTSKGTNNKKTIIGLFVSTLILCSIFCIQYPVSVVQAFESSSTNFEIHAGDAESVVASSTSGTFRLHNAGGQNATASSSLNISSVSSGILYWLYGFFVANYDQVHYRWRADDGTDETDATFPVNLDTQYASFPKNTVKRLRFEMSNEGRTRGGAPVFTLEVAQTATCSSGSYAAVPTDYSGHWHIATSTKITDGAATTNVNICSPQSDCITDENKNFITGEIKDTGNTTGTIALTSADFTEIEFGVMALDAATNANPYCFRLTNSGATSGTGYVFSYLQYAVASVTSGLPATGSLESAVFDSFNGGGENLGPAYNSIMWKGTEEGTGKVRFQFAASDCPNGETNPPTCNNGAWSWYGSNDGGVTCNAGLYYDTRTSGDGGGPGKPVEISCAGLQAQNNKRYYKYKIQICSSADCASSGQTSPIVTGAVVNFAP